jgi:hypothetical protein
VRVSTGMCMMYTHAKALHRLSPVCMIYIYIQWPRMHYTYYMYTIAVHRLSSQFASMGTPTQPSSGGTHSPKSAQNDLIYVNILWC